MGIVNVTPDSFFDGGRHDTTRAAVEHGLLLAAQGADVLDIGGESTRPGAKEVSVREELDRVLPVIRELAGRTELPLSIDTTKARVARECLEAGASWVNDVSAGVLDPEILDVCAQYGSPCVLMHMRGTPRTMQQNTRYEDLFGEIRGFFEERVSEAVRRGVEQRAVVLDPGIGFGKSAFDNVRLLAQPDRLRVHGLPLLYGPSRKSFMKLIQAADAAERLPGTLAAVTLLARSGVEMVRVHDVAATRQALDLVRVVREAEGGDRGAGDA